MRVTDSLQLVNIIHKDKLDRLGEVTREGLETHSVFLFGKGAILRVEGTLAGEFCNLLNEDRVVETHFLFD